GARIGNCPLRGTGQAVIYGIRECRDQAKQEPRGGLEHRARVCRVTREAAYTLYERHTLPSRTEPERHDHSRRNRTVSALDAAQELQHARSPLLRRRGIEKGSARRNSKARRLRVVPLVPAGRAGQHTRCYVRLSQTEESGRSQNL